MQYLCDSITVLSVTVNNGELWNKSLVKHWTQLFMHRALVAIHTTADQTHLVLFSYCLLHGEDETEMYMVEVFKFCNWATVC